MKAIEEYDKKSILGDELLEEIFACKNTVERTRMITTAETRASELRVKTQFDRMVEAYYKREQERQDVSLLERWTNFSDCPCGRMKCGSWIATDDGVRLPGAGAMGADLVACPHPILPVKRMINMQTGEEQVVIAFKRDGRWKELTVPKTTTTQASKITAMAAKSVNVTSENARLLVRFLSDVEAKNEAEIPIVLSSSKMGWVKGDFLPYGGGVEFDGDSRFSQTYKSIRPNGSRDVWYAHMKELRSLGKIEIGLALAASFAAPIIGITGTLPFIVDLWGETGNGKTVALMVAASVWADPDGKAYIKDYASTDVGLEALADFLNNLPVILDDTSKRNQYVERRLEEVVYNLTSGKGKTRSNKDLGINRESTWRTAILTNGEKPLTSYVAQGGAVNRILEVESQANIFDDPQRTVDVIKANYGHAGKDFIEVVKNVGAEKVRSVQRAFQDEIMKDKKAQKQSISLSVIMTADKIATDYLFRDGRYIDLEEAKKILVSQEGLSDGEQCYRYILDKISMNKNRFDGAANVEKWGMIEKGCAVFYPQALEDLCKAGNHSKDAFLSWAKRNGAILTDSKGCPTRGKKVDGRTKRCYFVRLGAPENDEKEGGFVDLDQYEQVEIPFK